MKIEASSRLVVEKAEIENSVQPVCHGNEKVVGHRRQPAHRWLALLQFARPLKVLLSEIRTLLPRIRMRCGKGRKALTVGRLYLQAQERRLLPNIRMHGRIDCIKRLASNHPWTTSADWRLAVDAWDQGVEWAVRNLGSDSILSEEHKSALVSELSYRGPS